MLLGPLLKSCIPPGFSIKWENMSRVSWWLATKPKEVESISVTRNENAKASGIWISEKSPLLFYSSWLNLYSTVSLQVIMSHWVKRIGYAAYLLSNQLPSCTSTPTTHLSFLGKRKPNVTAAVRVSGWKLFWHRSLLITLFLILERTTSCVSTSSAKGNRESQGSSNACVCTDKTSQWKYKQIISFSCVMEHKTRNGDAQVQIPAKPWCWLWLP